MACDARYSQAWSFAGFWCVASVLKGADDSGGGPNASLQDLDGNFINRGVEAMTGMVAYNVTAGTSGAITAVTATAVTAAGVTWSNGDVWRIATIDGEQIATIELYLDVAAADIWAALLASGACDCNLSTPGRAFLEKLNIIDAAAYYQCPCAQPRMTDEMRMKYLDWATSQLEALRDGRMEVCQGATGSEFPAIASAERGWTDFATAQIMINKGMREQ